MIAFCILGTVTAFAANAPADTSANGDANTDSSYDQTAEATTEVLQSVSYQNQREVYMAKLYLRETESMGALSGYARTVIQRFSRIQQDTVALFQDWQYADQPFVLRHSDVLTANELRLQGGDIDFVYASTEMDVNRSALAEVYDRDYGLSPAVDSFLAQEKALLSDTFEKARRENRQLCDSDPIMNFYACHR